MLRSIAKMGSVTMLAIIAMNGCGGDDDDEVTNPPPGPTTGSINVTVAGLPAATNAAVTVTGPLNYSRTVAATQTISGLAEGTYTVTAATVSTTDARYAPTPGTQTITVVAGTTPTANVSYALATGNLTINVSGLPSGTNAAIAVTGPNGFSRSVTATTTITALDPGVYTVVASNVTTSNDVFTPSVPSQQASVGIGFAPAVANVVYAAATGRLAITISGLPAAFGPLAAINAAVMVAGPNGYQRSVTETTTIVGLTPGLYTVTASPVAAAQYTYGVATPVLTAQVSGSTIPVNLTFVYGPIDATLTITVSGLPAGANSNVTVNGPNGYSRSITATTTLTRAPTGLYSITAGTVTVGSSTYSPSTATQNVVLAAGTGTTVIVTYSAPGFSLQGEEATARMRR